jgi:hypothetical protein
MRHPANPRKVHNAAMDARGVAPGLVGAAALGMLVHGPIPRLAHYHEFADTRPWLGIPHAADVLSNVPFAIVAAWGARRLARGREASGTALDGFAIFVAALALTAAGSSYYHWAPGDSRLAWDRLPIALACARLLGAFHARAYPTVHPRAWLVALCAFAVASVAWWARTGDLRPYLLLQGAPLVVIPLWQAAIGATARERIAFGIAIALYALAKAAELDDAGLFAATGFVSGHTLKHLLAAAAAAVIVAAATQISTRAPSSTTRLVGIAK